MKAVFSKRYESSGKGSACFTSRYRQPKHVGYEGRLRTVGLCSLERRSLQDRRGAGRGMGEMQRDSGKTIARQDVTNGVEEQIACLKNDGGPEQAANGSGRGMISA